MAKTLSMDLRQRIVQAYDRGDVSRQQVADRFAVSLGMVKKLLQQRRHTGDLAPRHRRAGRKPGVAARAARRLGALVAKRPDLTLAEMRTQLALECTLPAIHYVLVRQGLTYKKKTLRAAEQDRPDIARARRTWRRRQAGLDPARLIFLDESGAKTNLTRLRGRALRGRRLHAKAPHGHWKTTTMISSIRVDGTTACMTIESATDTAVFQEYVKKVLCPTLRPKDLVIMDNLSPHKNAQTRALIEQAGAEVRFLPAYSPDLNPIEKMWSKVKALLRGAQARTLPELQNAIAAALLSVTPNDARHWFASCGYAFI